MYISKQILYEALKRWELEEGSTSGNQSSVAYKNEVEHISLIRADMLWKYLLQETNKFDK